MEPSAHAGAREAPLVGGPVSEFFAALGRDWPLAAAQRARLGPAVEAALSIGWTPSALAEFTGVNTDGVRSPYAVLAARLSPAELPEPPARSARRPWCGDCDERTRMLGFDGDAPQPCPYCKTMTAMRDAPAPGCPATTSVLPLGTGDDRVDSRLAFGVGVFGGPTDHAYSRS